jgi:hypothetical protein
MSYELQTVLRTTTCATYFTRGEDLDRVRYRYDSLMSSQNGRGTDCGASSTMAQPTSDVAAPRTHCGQAATRRSSHGGRAP